PYGDYEFTAIAEDQVGLIDPDPPVVHVHYTDLTPPEQIRDLDARGDAGVVRLSWRAAPDDDFASYTVQRQDYNGEWLTIAEGLSEPELVDASELWSGQYTYRVIALDNFGNASLPSEPDEALLFEVWAEPPYSPISAP